MSRFDYDSTEDEFVIDLHGKRCDKDEIIMLALIVKSFSLFLYREE